MAHTVWHQQGLSIPAGPLRSQAYNLYLKQVWPGKEGEEIASIKKCWDFSGEVLPVSNFDQGMYIGTLWA